MTDKFCKEQIASIGKEWFSTINVEGVKDLLNSMHMKSEYAISSVREEDMNTTRASMILMNALTEVCMNIKDLIVEFKNLKK